MKKLFFVALISALVAGKCNKEDATTPCTAADPSTEEAAITAYNTIHGITGTKLSSGMYYQIINAGTGNTPTATSTVRAQYTGKLVSNDSIFDKNLSLSGASFPLSSVIQGWQMGLPLIKSGGTIKLVIPSKYAYGCTGTTGIPANSPLYFEITLLAVF